MPPTDQAGDLPPQNNMGKIKNLRTEEGEKLKIVQRLWVDTTTLTLDKEACIACDLCRHACPKEAISIYLGESEPELDIDEDKCSLCGMCVAICPAHAVSMVHKNTWRGTEEAIKPLLQYGGIPDFSRGMDLNAAFCPPGCDRCIKACPRDALWLERGQIHLDRDRCLSCAHCADVCPVEGACQVSRLFEGQIHVSPDRCPVGCEACIKACPTGCYTALDDHGVGANSRNCICCGACLVACPNGAIDLTRLRVRTGGGFSAVWSRAVDRLMEEHARFLRHNEGALSRAIEVLKKTRM